MSYKVLLHPKVAKALNKMESTTRSKIITRLKEMQERPEKVGKPLKYTDFWSLRIGDYRAIYQVNKSKNEVIILFIGHRRNVYDDFSKVL